MSTCLESAVAATAEVRVRADYLSKTTSEAEQEVNYKLLQPLIEENVSLDVLYLPNR